MSKGGKVSVMGSGVVVHFVNFISNSTIPTIDILLRNILNFPPLLAIIALTLPSLAMRKTTGRAPAKSP